MRLYWSSKVFCNIQTADVSLISLLQALNQFQKQQMRCLRNVKNIFTLNYRLSYIHHKKLLKEIWMFDSSFCFKGDSEKHSVQLKAIATLPIIHNQQDFDTWLYNTKHDARILQKKYSSVPLSLRFRKSFDDPFQTGGVSKSIWFNSCKKIGWEGKMIFT